MTAFFQLHRDLPREGPGEPADVAWAAQIANLRPDARIADVACGPGGDVGALLDAAPDGHVTALDKTAHFVGAVRDTWGQDSRVTALRADMAAIANTYDMIWCAGAVYFLGVVPALTQWRKSLRKAGTIAFSEPSLFTDTPAQSTLEFWGDYPHITNADGIAAQVRDAGYKTLATGKLSDAAWEAYYTPLEARIETLKGQSDPALSAVIEETQQEIAGWRKARAETGYLLSVVTPT